MTATTVLHLDSVSLTYRSRGQGEVTALQQMDLDVRDNEFITIVGQSGCGKSTLLRLVSGLLAPTTGAINLAGRPVTGPRNDVGIVFQSPVLLPWRTVLDNVLLPIEFLKMDPAKYKPRARELLALVSLKGFENAYPRTLSGGMQQRVSISRALVSDPRILLMDEPFGALDAMTREELSFELLRIWDERKKTVLFVTHSIPEAVLLANRVVVMTPRPARVAKIIEVNLPRPRTIEMEFSSEFREATDQIRELIYQKEAGGMNNERLWNLPAWVLPSIAMGLLVALWEAAVDVFVIPLYIIPAPSAIVTASLNSGRQIPFHTFITLYETVVGFAVAVMIGIGLGIVIVSSRLLRDTFFPLLVIAQSVPKVAIAPVLLITLGYGELPKIIIVFLVCFFPIVVSTSAGLDPAPREVLDLARSMSATTIDTFRKVRFPSAMPQIFVGLKVAVILAVIGAIIGEFVGSDRGLGYLILVSMSQANTPLAFGAIAVLAVMSILLFYGVELLERILVPWAQD